MVRPAEKVPPLGAGVWGQCGTIQWGTNNFVVNSGNEPIWYRQMFRVMDCGANWFEPDRLGTSGYGLWNSGFLSGADLRIYRLVDKDGHLLPTTEKTPNGTIHPNYDASLADHVVFMGTGQVIPEKTDGFPEGGWIANKYAAAQPRLVNHGNLSATDALTLENDQTYWYAVTAMGPNEQQSPFSNEVSARPAADRENAPHLLALNNPDAALTLKAGAPFQFQPGWNSGSFHPGPYGGVAPYRWEAVDEQGQPVDLPEGLKLNKTMGIVSGTVKAAPQDWHLRLRVTDANGHSDTRAWIVNPTPATAGAADAKAKLLPPQDLKAVAGNHCVTLTWKASSSPNATGYQIFRSPVPLARQVDRIFVTANTPKLAKWDYVVFSKRMDPFEMRWVSPRVRGVLNPVDSPSWYWRADSNELSFALVRHPQPIPAAMVDPGETCMRITSPAGQHAIWQTVFGGTSESGSYEAAYFGQLEPGKQYALEVWLRQEGLADGGAVAFSYTRGAYPGIHHTFQVTGEWQKYVYTFVGPERPKKQLPFGHQFAFAGPGTLWMDNCRIFRADQPADLTKPYVPNATILNALLASQPATGRKGVHRIYIINRYLTMSNLLSWHGNSSVAPDTQTSVGGSEEMTIPMALAFDLQTGDSPQTRMRPWFTIQHILFSEQDWLNFIEYLAAPYDPAHDTPQTKPWAYRRYRQRGIGTPWSDEFSQFTLEFGNETWHQGIYPDWFGFARFLHIFQGGKEYGLFTRYLCETMMKSPYWKSAQLDKKFRFSLGAFYDGDTAQNGRVTGYGEEAIQVNPYATVLGHATYVGPKWELGQESSPLFDDSAVQAALLGCVGEQAPRDANIGRAREVLAKRNHAYDLGAYESGPSGYVPRPGLTPEQYLAKEKQGKSLAMGVAALDTWLHAYLHGWTDQMYSCFSQGWFWSSHTPLAEGFRPHCAWLAQTMRNQFARGDMVQVNEKSNPTILWSKHAYPLIGVFAMRDQDRWSVFVLSRKLDGRHDGHDFGDGATPVTLNLPFRSATAITLHKLTGNPRESNREKMNIAIQTQNVPVTTMKDGSFAVNEAAGGDKNGMPPGSIYLYVFEGTSAH